MGPFEYLLMLAVVVLGLALSDLAMSVHRLLAAGKRVRWDRLAPMAAAVAFLKIVTQWWVWFGAAGLAAHLTFAMYVGELASTILLFLLAAAALPDEAVEGTIDLRAHYEGVARRYWLLFLAHFLLSNAISIWAQLQIAHARFDWLQPGWLIAPLALSLAFVRARWWHTLCLLALLVLYLVQLFGQALA